MLEFGLPGNRIDGVERQRINAHPGHEAAAPVHRNKNLATAQFLAGLHLDDEAAATAFHPHQIAVAHLAALHVLAVHRQQRLFDVGVEPRHQPGPAHAMPLVAQPAGIQMQGIACVDRLGHRPIRRVVKMRPALVGRKHAVFIQARLACGGALRQRPLLRAGVEHGIAQAGDIEIAATGGFAVFVEHVFGTGIREQPFAIPPQRVAQPPRKLDHRLAIGSRFARRRNRRAHPRDTPLGIGHGAVAFAPGGGRQQQVGELHRFGINKRFLHHHKFRSLQGLLHQLLVGQGLRRIGAGNPQRLDFALAHRLEHFNGRLAGLVGHGIHSPQPGDFGAVFGVAHIAMRRQQMRHAADFAPTHRIGLPGQRQRRGARLADVPGGQMQVDQRRVLVDAAS